MKYQQKIKFLLSLVSILVSTISIAQDESQTDRSKLAIKAGYFGEFVMHPGFYSGIDYNLLDKSWLDLHWDTDLGAYFHKWNNNSVFVQSSFGARFCTSFSMYTDLQIGIGYMLSTPSGELYQVDKDGNLTEKGKPVTSHAKPTVSLLFGWDGNRKKDIPLTIGFGLEAYWQMGYNHIALPHAALKAGITYQLKTKKS